jgi:hypothetical protein
MISVEAVQAYWVNGHDGKGKQLMSYTEVETLIDDKLGAVVDALGFPSLLSPKEKLAIHDKLRAQLPQLQAVIELITEFEEAKQEFVV